MPTKPRHRVTGDPLVKALAHPLRMRMIRLLQHRVASPSDIAREFEQSLPNVAYHMRILVNCDCVELVETRQRRGTIEHFYRAITRPWFDDEHWRAVPISVRRQLVGGTLEDIFQKVAAATTEGGFDHPLMHVSSTPIALDQQAWEEMSELLTETVQRALAISAASIGRSVTGEAHERRAELCILQFERASTDRS